MVFALFVPFASYTLTRLTFARRLACDAIDLLFTCTLALLVHRWVDCLFQYHLCFRTDPVEVVKTWVARQLAVFIDL
jgi:hypothetical protein